MTIIEKRVGFVKGERRNVQGGGVNVGMNFKCKLLTTW